MSDKKITNKFDAYDNFLDALILNLEHCRQENNKKLELYKNIKTILHKRRTGNMVSDEEYASLAETCCPEEDLIQLFNGQAEFCAEGVMTLELDRLLWLCPTVNCVTCWRNFINTISESINRSETLIKKIEPLKEDNKKYVVNDYMSLEELLDLLSLEEPNGDNKNDRN